MVTKEAIRICSGLKSAVIKIPMTKVKATALKQPFSALLKNIVQIILRVQFNKRSISNSIVDRLDNKVV